MVVCRDAKTTAAHVILVCYFEPSTIRIARFLKLK